MGEATADCDDTEHEEPETVGTHGVAHLGFAKVGAERGKQSRIHPIAVRFPVLRTHLERGRKVCHPRSEKQIATDGAEHTQPETVGTRTDPLGEVGRGRTD